MLSSVYGLVNKNLLVFEARQKLGSLTISRNKVNGFELKNVKRPPNSKVIFVHGNDAEYENDETPVSQVKELNEDREDEHNHNDVEQLLQKSELPMPSKDE
jgi:hypothetical protein